MSSVFVTPLPASAKQSAASKSKVRSRKRELNGRHKSRDSDESDAFNDASMNQDPRTSNDEYTAVITPDERAQRRLAGHTLSGDLPPFPFPHAAASSARETQGALSEPTVAPESSRERGQISLRSQHVAAMSAVLHKSLLAKDWSRASRALGLILRTSAAGQSIDIRAARNWAIAAEILFRRAAGASSEHMVDAQEAGDSDSSPGPTHNRGISRRGFEDARSLYKKLIVQYPYHKSWPDSVNAIDFYIAMFNLWIYVAQADGATARRQISKVGVPVSEDDSTDLSTRALQEANEIADEMDSCMSSVPFSENRELIRLRANIALWQKDLNEDLMTFPAADVEGQELSNASTPFSSNQRHAWTSSATAVGSSQFETAAREAHKTAHRHFDRLASPESFGECE